MLKTIFLTIFIPGLLTSSIDEICSNEQVELKCNPNEIIIIQSVTKTNTLSCIDSFESHNSHCSTYHDDDIKTQCEGKSNCNFTLNTQQHYPGFYGSNCNFKSNRAQINYVCIPVDFENSKFKYDVCNSVFAISNSRTNQGFIHSPNYPNYYGNSRKCKMMVNLEEDERLELFLINMNIEDRSIFNKVNDYLKINGDKYYGSRRNLIVYNTTKDVCIDFVSDFITTQKLNMPKGFLIYFKITKFELKTIWSKITEAVSNIIFTVPIVSTMTTTTSTTTTNNPEPVTSAIPIFIPHVKNDFLESNRNNDKLEIQEQKSTLLTCIIVALTGLMIILVTSILLLLRRRQRQENEDYYDDNKYYVIIDRILTLNGRFGQSKTKNQQEKKDMPTIVSIEKAVDDYKLESKPLQTEKNQKAENIYASNPLDIHREKSQPDENNLSLQSEDLYEVINEVYSNEFDSTQCDYSTPTNREFIPSDSLNSTNGTIDGNTSTTKLLK